MFSECSSLSAAPALPATELANNCYYAMFNKCASLETAPALPATRLADGCYTYMFCECPSLKKAPELPAKTILPYSYYAMFYGCQNISELTVGLTDWGEEPDTYAWVYSLASEGIFTCPECLEVKYGYSYIPEGWIVKTK